MDVSNSRNILVVSINELNQESTGMIFEELNNVGVIEFRKDTERLAMLVSPAKFDEMIESLENYELLISALNRVTKVPRRTIHIDDIMRELGITQADLDNVDIDLDLL